MGKEIVLFESEEPKSLTDVSAFLHELADKLDTNKVVLRQGEQEVEVTLPDNVVLELKVEEEDKKGKKQYQLEVEIEWYEGGAKGGGPVTLG